MVRLLLHPRCCQLLSKTCHDDVLKRSARLNSHHSLPSQFFGESDYTDCTGRKLPCYQSTRDGFAFLLWGFTGKRAAQFKEAYINAFNQMEKQLSNPLYSSDAAHKCQRSLFLHFINSSGLAAAALSYVGKSESPLAVSLHDYINDASALACLYKFVAEPLQSAGAQMIRNIFKRFTNQTFRCPRPGQYTTPAGHVLRVSLRTVNVRR